MTDLSKGIIVVSILTIAFLTSMYFLLSEYMEQEVHLQQASTMYIRKY